MKTTFREYVLNEAINAKSMADFLDGQPIEWDDYGKRGDMASALKDWAKATKDWDESEVADDMGIKEKDVRKYLDFIIANADAIAKIMQSSGLPDSIAKKISSRSDVAGFLKVTNGKIDDLVKMVEKQGNISEIYVNEMFFDASIPTYMGSFKSEHIALLKGRKFQIAAGDGKNLKLSVRLS